uniref:Putative secreted protein n=1 Tax=Ixodes ricinus TaxID=34613 RepID=A0A147BT25_IXORI
MVLAGQHPSARLLAGRAPTVATLATAGVPPAVSQLLALGLAGVVSTAGHGLLAGTAAATLRHHLQARGAVPCVTPLAAAMQTARQELVARVAARPHVFSARTLPL